MSFDGFVSDRHEGLVGTGAAAHPGLVAHAGLPLVCADGRVACPALRGVLPAPGIDILPATEEGPGRAQSCHSWANGWSPSRWGSHSSASSKSSARSWRAASPGPPARRPAAPGAYVFAPSLRHGYPIAPFDSPSLPPPLGAAIIVKGGPYRSPARRAACLSRLSPPLNRFNHASRDGSDVEPALHEVVAAGQAPLCPRQGLVFCLPRERRDLNSGLSISFSAWQCAVNGDAAGRGLVH